ncbi:aminoglycoside phosphotransferase APH(3') [Mycobacterium sp. CBMA 234]|uniref:aminoglycoside 3'-phosphotransferase n=1 Tax=Mycolicibacterium sp. CBMA 234 TaxID=1918495 RepID=UPI001390DECD|nr:aminoglycoside 3'-phosphotransferase [Mycolicibacterium sp. CBMA 234]MUL66271.1 aminoglycoside phosphotransferase APH(3') [Mycolicibacterium sp. CBMA 234]
MTVPTAPVPVPDVVDALSGGRLVTAVWKNELGGVTFAIGAGDEYVKTYPAEHAALLTDEAVRLRWAGQYIAVPPVLGEGAGWLHTAGLPGRSAVDPVWTDDPETAARAIGTGLRAMHDALPVADCPFGRPSWVCDEPGGTAPDLLVVCHGDPCAPNTLMSADGAFVGHVDIGDLGVADRWADLAIATMSLDWNYPGNYEAALLDAYGVTRDAERIDHYRGLWDAPEPG